MIRPKIPLVQNGQRLTSDLVNSMIHRTEYAADLLRQYRLTAGTEMYVEPHYDGTRVSYFYPVGGGATPRGSEITIPPEGNVIELQPGIVYVYTQDEFLVDGIVKIFTLSAFARSQGIFITGGSWEYLNNDGDWQGLLDTGVITPLRLTSMNGFRATPGRGTYGPPYWGGGTIQIL